jgi:hypothetical protein
MSFNQGTALMSHSDSYVFFYGFAYMDFIDGLDASIVRE